MPQLTVASAKLSKDGTYFVLSKGSWQNEYPLADLDRWIEFYRKMRREHPKSQSSYDRTIAALEELAKGQGINMEAAAAPQG